MRFFFFFQFLLLVLFFIPMLLFHRGKKSDKTQNAKGKTKSEFLKFYFHLKSSVSKSLRPYCASIQLNISTLIIILLSRIKKTLKLYLLDLIIIRWNSIKSFWTTQVIYFNLQSIFNFWHFKEFRLGYIRRNRIFHDIITRWECISL